MGVRDKWKGSRLWGTVGGEGYDKLAHPIQPEREERGRERGRQETETKRQREIEREGGRTGHDDGDKYRPLLDDKSHRR